MRKPFILIFVAIITAVLIYALIYYIGIQGPAFAISLNFMLMAGTLMFTEISKSPLNSPYFNVKKWERDGKIYVSFGINFYRKLLVWMGWERLNKKSKPVEKNTKSLIQLHYHTKQDELGHLMIMFVVLGFTIVVACKFGIGKSLWLLFSNILLNVYPIFLQRYNRPRIERAINLSRRR